MDALDTAPRAKTANLAPAFVVALTQAVGATPSPEDTLAYIYAILYAPSYRTRYADFLKRDFPRVPLTSDRELFDALVAAGRELIALHTMQTTLPRITGFPVAGSNEVVKVRVAPSPPSSGRGSREAWGDVDADAKSHPPRRASRAFAFAPPFVPKGEETADTVAQFPFASEGGRKTGLVAPKGEEIRGRVWINTEQYFEGVPEAVWNMHIGGYRVAEKWLKDRKGRQLSFDDIEHYQRVIAALARTSELQAGIDTAIDAAGGWPLG